MRHLLILFMLSVKNSKENDEQSCVYEKHSVTENFLTFFNISDEKYTSAIDVNNFVSNYNDNIRILTEYIKEYENKIIYDDVNDNDFLNKMIAKINTLILNQNEIINDIKKFMLGELFKLYKEIEKCNLKIEETILATRLFEFMQKISTYFEEIQLTTFYNEFVHIKIFEKIENLKKFINKNEIEEYERTLQTFQDFLAKTYQKELFNILRQENFDIEIQVKKSWFFNQKLFSIIDDLLITKLLESKNNLKYDDAINIFFWLKTEYRNYIKYFNCAYFKQETFFVTKKDKFIKLIKEFFESTGLHDNKLARIFLFYAFKKLHKNPNQLESNISKNCLLYFGQLRDKLNEKITAKVSNVFYKLKNDFLQDLSVTISINKKEEIFYARTVKFWAISQGENIIHRYHFELLNLFKTFLENGLNLYNEGKEKLADNRNESEILEKTLYEILSHVLAVSTFLDLLPECLPKTHSSHDQKYNDEEFSSILHLIFEPLNTDLDFAYHALKLLNVTSKDDLIYKNGINFILFIKKLIFDSKKKLLQIINENIEFVNEEFIMCIKTLEYQFIRLDSLKIFIIEPLEETMFFTAKSARTNQEQDSTIEIDIGFLKTVYEMQANYSTYVLRYICNHYGLTACIKGNLLQKYIPLKNMPDIKISEFSKHSELKKRYHGRVFSSFMLEIKNYDFTQIEHSLSNFVGFIQFKKKFNPNSNKDPTKNDEKLEEDLQETAKTNKKSHKLPLSLSDNSSIFENSFEKNDTLKHNNQDSLQNDTQDSLQNDTQNTLQYDNQGTLKHNNQDSLQCDTQDSLQYDLSNPKKDNSSKSSSSKKRQNSTKNMLQLQLQ